MPEDRIIAIRQFPAKADLAVYILEATYTDTENCVVAWIEKCIVFAYETRLVERYTVGEQCYREVEYGFLFLREDRDVDIYSTNDTDAWDTVRSCGWAIMRDDDAANENILRRRAREVIERELTAAGVAFTDADVFTLADFSHVLRLAEIRSNKKNTAQ